MKYLDNVRFEISELVGVGLIGTMQCLCGIDSIALVQYLWPESGKPTLTCTVDLGQVYGYWLKSIEFETSGIKSTFTIDIASA